MNYANRQRLLDVGTLVMNLTPANISQLSKKLEALKMIRAVIQSEDDVPVPTPTYPHAVEEAAHQLRTIPMEKSMDVLNELYETGKKAGVYETIDQGAAGLIDPDALHMNYRQPFQVYQVEKPEPADDDIEFFRNGGI